MQTGQTRLAGGPHMRREKNHRAGDARLPSQNSLIDDIPFFSRMFTTYQSQGYLKYPSNKHPHTRIHHKANFRPICLLCASVPASSCKVKNEDPPPRHPSAPRDQTRES
jgi:hypothetical protein